MDPNLEQNYNTAKDIGTQFLRAFFSPGCNIAQFYGNDSVLNLESEVYFGQQKIVEKLMSFKLNVNPSNYEFQPSNNGVLMYVSGTCVIEGETRQLPFTRVIFLAAQGQSYYIKNDIYKITLV